MTNLSSSASVARSTSELQNIDRAHHIHPLTDHKTLHASGTHVIVSGDGCFVTDTEGNRLLDIMAGLWCVNVGYGRTEIAEAVYEQLKTLPYYCSALSATTDTTILLAEKLTGLVPPHLSHVYFSSSGSEGNESALKLIRFYSKRTGRGGRTKILTRKHSYHGATLATSSMSGIPAILEPFDLPLDGFISCPAPHYYLADTDMTHEEYGRWCVEETARIIEREDPETISAMFVEPVQGAGGVVIPPPGYLRDLRELCRSHSILFVADEVITGFGRLGEWFGSQLWDLDPDLMNTAKAITSGYQPLSALFVREEIADIVIEGGFFSHINTYAGHPAAAAAALANLSIIESENLVPRTRDTIGPYLQRRLRGFVDHPLVGEVRGLGLIAAMELQPSQDQQSREVALGPLAFKMFREEGVIIRAVGNTLTYCPPLIIKESEVDFLVEATHKVLARLAAA